MFIVFLYGFYLFMCGWIANTIHSNLIDNHHRWYHIKTTFLNYMWIVLQTVFWSALWPIFILLSILISY